MRYMPKWETIAGWLYFGLGAVILQWHEPLIDDTFRFRVVAESVFPRHIAYQYFLTGFLILSLIPASGLAFLTGWGVKRKRRWARWTGLFPSALMLLGFPWLTLAGAASIFYLFRVMKVETPSMKTAHEYWDVRRQSVWVVILSVLGWFVARGALTRFEGVAERFGFPEGPEGFPSLAVLLILIWIHIAVHEAGHALAAWSVGFRVKSIGIGPLNVRHDYRGLRFRIDWRSLLLSSGYVGSVPVTAEGVWWKQISIVAAGPLTTFAFAAVFLAAMFLMRGTSFAIYWHIAASGAALGVYIGAINLVPLGYSDGTMLYHLLLRTRRGEELIALILATQYHHQAQDCEQEADYREQADVMRAGLDRLLAQGEPDPARLCHAYLMLGRAETAAHRYREAEGHLSQALEYLPEPFSRAEAMIQACLQRIYIYRYDCAAADRAWRRAVEIDDVAREKLVEREHVLTMYLAVAELHHTAHAHDAVLAETDRALENYPAAARYRFLKGRLLNFRARAAFHLGSPEAALAAAEEAERIFRADDGFVEGIAAAPQQLGLLGYDYWSAGRAEKAFALLRDTIALLERRGVRHLAASFRICLAAILCEHGSPAAAACVLPEEPKAREARRDYFERRGAIRWRGGRLREAIADYTAALAVTEPEDELAVATLWGCLANAHLDAGDLAQAEAFAAKAAAVFTPSRHPELVSPCFTLALIAARRGDPASHHVAEGLAIWRDARFILPAGRARFLEFSATRFEHAALEEAAARCREEAARQWAQLAPRIDVEPAAELSAVTA